MKISMSYRVSKLFLICLATFEVLNGVYGTFRECITPLSDAGKCVSLKNCPEVLLLYQKLPKDQATKYSNLLRNLCGNGITYDRYPMVCCRRPNFRNDYEVIPVWIDYSVETTESNPMLPTTESHVPTESTKIVDRDSEKPCLDKGNQIGLCKSLEKCPELLDAITSNPANETVKEHLRYSHTICDSIGTNVCCLAKPKKASNPNGVFESAPSRPPTEDEGCGRDRHTYIRRIIDGQESEIGAWPWIALLGYNPYSANPFRCGGTLITARHVLTAAHCILRDLSFVRLGEHDLSTEDDTTHVDVNIAKALTHEKYSKTEMRFDIALLYLERNVVFTDMINPICLPMSDELRTKSFVSYMPFAAGWGRTSFENTTTPNVLHEVQLFVYENSVCQEAFRLVLRSRGRRFSDNFDSSVLCVGDSSAGIKDTCRGDSGGPLMTTERFKGVSLHYLIGITSYGIGCAKPGVPAIYTSTQYFMDWILEKIRET